MALDKGNRERAECQGKRVTSPTGTAQSLEYYFGSNLYDLAIAIELQSAIDIERSVVERLKHRSNTQTRTTEETTANLRTPVILCLGGCCSAFANGNNPKKDSRELDCFLNVLKTAARPHVQKPDAKPQENFIENSWNLTHSNQHNETPQPVRQRRWLLNQNEFKTGESFEISVDNAFIFVSGVAMANGDAVGFRRRKPVIVRVWLGNEFNRSFAIFESERLSKNIPSGSVEHGVNRQPVNRALLFQTVEEDRGDRCLLVRWIPHQSGVTVKDFLR